MKTIWKRIGIAGTALFLLAAAPACTRTETGGEADKTIGESVDDVAITGKVKSALLADESVSGMDVNVTTHLKQVQLSGFVDTEAQKKRAEEIAKTVDGVKSVKNDIVVKNR